MSVSQLDHVHGHDGSINSCNLRRAWAICVVVVVDDDGGGALPASACEAPR